MKQMIVLIESCKDCDHCKLDKPLSAAINGTYVCEKTGEHVVNRYMAREHGFPPIPDSCPLSES